MIINRQVSDAKDSDRLICKVIPLNKKMKILDSENVEIGLVSLINGISTFVEVAKIYDKNECSILPISFNCIL